MKRQMMAEAQPQWIRLIMMGDRKYSVSDGLIGGSGGAGDGVIWDEQCKRLIIKITMLRSDEISSDNNATETLTTQLVVQQVTPER